MYWMHFVPELHWSPSANKHTIAESFTDYLDKETMQFLK